MVILVVIGALGTVPDGSGEKTEGVGKQRKTRDYPDNSIVEIGKNTEKSPVDLRRLAFTQTLEKNHQQMLVEKLAKRLDINYMVVMNSF